MGCIDDYSWCDVVFGDNRGWVYAGSLAYPYQNGRVPILGYGAIIGLPIITFSIGNYWDSYYRGRPWYRNRSYWVNRPPPRHYRPPQHFDRPQVRGTLLGLTLDSGLDKGRMLWAVWQLVQVAVTVRPLLSNPLPWMLSV